MTRARSKLALESPAPLEPGAMVDGFRVERVLSVGTGHAVVVQALAPGGSRVAIKLLDHMASDSEQWRQAIRMARTRAAIDHPHLVRLLKVGEHDGRLYVVSELRGTTRLADRLSQGPFETGDALRVVAGVAGALDAATREQLVHRELTSQAILLDDNAPAHALLTDFGVGRERLLPQRLRIDVEGADYRSPEEIRGGPLTPECNAYSLACVLFECLTGSPPYPYERPLLTLHAHLVEPPARPSQLRSGLPAELDDVFARAMAKQPDQRLGASGLVRAAAQALGEEVEIPAGAAREAEKRPARRPKRVAIPARPRRSAAPTRPERSHAPPRPRRPAEPARPKPPAEPARPKRAAKQPARPKRAAAPARPKKVAAAKPKRAPKRRRGAQPAQRRSRGLRFHPALALVLAALAASAVSGFTLGRSDPESAPPIASPAQPQTGSAELAQAEYVRSVSPVIDRLSARRAVARQKLRRAQRPEPQAAAASALAKAYADAGRQMSAESSTSPEGARLRAQLRSAERAYRRLAAAATNENERAWREASRAAIEHERRFERSLLTLTTA